jgi:hypothetical protein
MQLTGGLASMLANHHTLTFLYSAINISSLVADRENFPKNKSSHTRKEIFNFATQKITSESHERGVD